MDWTDTTSTGSFEFINLPGGHCYRITEDVRPGWQQTSQPADFWLSRENPTGLYLGNYYPTIIISPADYDLNSGDVGQAYSQAFNASGGAGPYMFTVDAGNLPAGMTFSADGTLSGTPTMAGKYDLAIKAEDANQAVGYHSYALTIFTNGDFIIASTSNPSAPGDLVTFSVSATGSALLRYWTEPVAPLGTVTFYTGDTVIDGCSNVLLNVGFDEYGYQIIGVYPATCTTAALPEGTHQIRAVYTDYVGAYYDAELSLTQVVGQEQNTAPVANSGGPYLGAINIAIPFDGSGSSDLDGDPLTYAWTFGDGSTSQEAAPSHTYTAAGIYNACLTVNDGELDSPQVCTLAVIYDPSAGFVTGGGWIDSPAGAYLPDANLSGKATFGFVSRYKKGASAPEGTTAFQFDMGDFEFYSSAYEWLVVSKDKVTAQFKGSGTVNGAMDPNGNAYKFMLWAGDTAPDTFRIRIWWEVDGMENVVYDNGFDQAIGAGNIFVHTGK